MQFSRKKDNILNNIHSAQGRKNFSEIQDLQKELEMMQLRQEIEDRETTPEENQEMQDLKKLIARPTKQEIQQYIQEQTSILIDEESIDSKTIELITILQDIANTNPKKKELIKDILIKYINKIQIIEKRLKEYKNSRGEDSSPFNQVISK